MDFVTLLYICLGVIIAVVLPVLTGLIRKEFPATAGVGMPPWVRKYLLLAVFSIVTAIILYAGWTQFNPDKTLDWAAAIVLGFGWESFLEKLTAKDPTKI